MADDQGKELEKHLPDLAQARLQSLRLADGVATLVLDVTGLDGLERDRLEIAVKDALRSAPGVSEVRVAMMGEKRARNIIAVGSGKGGVGKSTLSANLAIALARSGIRTGLVDADIYGPSQARLMATEGARPQATSDKKLLPVASQWGVPMLSMAHLASPGQAIAWRGPMAGNALSQLVDADWGDTELLIVDLPPGTGDVQLTMLQRFKPAGAVIVSTPQDLALADARRGVAMFRKVDVPILGVIENMSYFKCPHCGERTDLFGHGGAEKEAQDLGVRFLGEIPLHARIRELSDAGTPVVAVEPTGEHASAYSAIADMVWTSLESGAGQRPAPRIVVN
jgi:ATP-binding protein involved in chromosome partitioning